MKNKNNQNVKLGSCIPMDIYTKYSIPQKHFYILSIDLFLFLHRNPPQTPYIQKKWTNTHFLYSYSHICKVSVPNSGLVLFITYLFSFSFHMVLRQVTGIWTLESVIPLCYSPILTYKHTLYTAVEKTIQNENTREQWWLHLLVFPSEQIMNWQILMIQM